MDLVLGTPFLFQHKVMLSFHPSRVVIGLKDLVSLEGSKEMTIVSSIARIVLEEEIERIHTKLRNKGADLCQDTAKTRLPPL